MNRLIKSEPIDYEGLDYNQNNLINDSPPEKPSFIESQYQSEKRFINNIQNVFGSNSDDEYDYFSGFMPSVSETPSILPDRNICFIDAFLQMKNSNSFNMNEDDARKPTPANNFKSTNKMKNSFLDNKVRKISFMLKIKFNFNVFLTYF